MKSLFNKIKIESAASNAMEKRYQMIFNNIHLRTRETVPLSAGKLRIKNKIEYTTILGTNPVQYIVRLLFRYRMSASQNFFKWSNCLFYIFSTDVVHTQKSFMETELYWLSSDVSMS